MAHKLTLAASMVAAALLAGCSKEPAENAQTEAQPAPAAERVVHVYNWSDYIEPSVLEDFTKETGIKVVYDVFDSNETLEAKVLTGGTGFDIVVPSGSFLARQIQAGAYQPLDRAQLTNYANLDPAQMKLLESWDAGNQIAVPYMMGSTGIGYNVAKVKEVLGENAPVDSWDLVFKEENLAKLKKCGVMFLDAPAEIFAPMLNYLGKNPLSVDPKEYEQVASPMLQKLGKHVTKFHSSEYINALATGEICVAIGWSGDIGQAATRAEEAKNGIEIKYVIPKEGTEIFYDMMAIPKDAKNVAEAHAFINYILKPEVTAKITNFVAYANANSASTQFVDPEIKNDPGVYPTPETMAKLWTLRAMPLEVDRVMTREWNKAKTGQ